MYRLILLDADNTIFDYDKAEEFALKSSLDNFGYNEDFNEIRDVYREINSSLWRALEQGKVTRDELREKRFRMLFSRYDLEYSVSDFSKLYLEYLGQGDFLIDGAQEICQYLSSRYEVVILTNGITEVQLSRLEKSLIKDYINDIIISEEAGTNKPDPEIFEYTFRKVNHVSKDDVMIIGDSLTSDIQGGINFGIDTCWFNRNNAENKSEVQPTYHISKLDELKKLL